MQVDSARQAKGGCSETELREKLGSTSRDCALLAWAEPKPSFLAASCRVAQAEMAKMLICGWRKCGWRAIR